jgi:diaminopimelate epimerase
VRSKPLTVKKLLPYVEAVLIQFTKMHGAGNDFVLIDNREGRLRISRQNVVALCDRHLGIGADGLILLKPAQGRTDWAWDFYNSDGSIGEMCGNGARCFARFVQQKTGLMKPTVSFETAAGIITARFSGNRVTVNLTEPESLRLNEQLELSTGPQTVHSINTGVPHAVFFVPNADKAMLEQLGPQIRHHPRFAPKGTNVNFVQLLAPNHIRVRTFERGVEGETLACGTGVTASALISSRVHGFASPVRVTVQSGDQLEVAFTVSTDGFKDVHLSGPAAFVFEGQIEVG